MAYHQTVTDISNAEAALATNFPMLVTRTFFSQRSGEGRQMSHLKLASNVAGQPRVSVLFVGGVHARELAPPAALLELAETLCNAYVAGSGITINAFSVSADEVRRILDRSNLHLLPMANPDGRAFVPTNNMWRKSRRPANCPGPPDRSGTDINRNFDIAWDFQTYYNAQGEADVSASTNPCDFQRYVGPPGARQPETQNIASLIDGLPLRWYVDVHSFGPKIYFPWGLESNGTDPAQNFRNPTFDNQRDGKNGSAYAEFFPDWAQQHIPVANLMRDAMNAATGATYIVVQSVVDAMTTGASDDYAFSRSFVIPDRRTFAFTIECGSEAENGFHPSAAQFPKISREVQAALLRLLVFATAPTAPSSSGSSSSSWCPFTFLYGSAHDPDVAYLRSWRARYLEPHAAGRAVIAAYERVGPGATRFLANHAAVADGLTHRVLRPVIGSLRRRAERRK